MTSQSEWHDLRSETNRIWENLAGFWDEYMGDEGNDFHRLLVAPTALRLLEPKPAQRILDAACGNGAFARQLARLGVEVVGCDVSPTFVERAAQRSQSFAEQVSYQVVDLTELEQILSLGEASFDAVVSNMALMDLPAIEPFFKGVRRLLRPGGRFVFTLCHPCFNAVGTRKLVEQEDHDGTIVVRHAVKVTHYLTCTHGKGIGIRSQPEPQHYFDRPLTVLFNAGFRAGFVMDGFEEVGFPAGSEAKSPFAWENYTETPPVLGVRLRPSA